MRRREIRLATTIILVGAMSLAAPALGADNAPAPKGTLAGAFEKPTKPSILTAPEGWPTFFDRAPVNLAPKGGKTKVVVLGTGTPSPNAERFGPALALIVNDYPYFVDAGEGWWRALAKASLMNGDLLRGALVNDNLKYLFLTHLHEDHTVGVPSFILNPYKYNMSTKREIYGPPGTASMIENIQKAWTVDINDMVHGTAQYNDVGWRANSHDIKDEGQVFKDDNVTVEAFRTEHGDLKYTWAYRFTTPDRVVAFGGDGHYSPGLVKAAKGADLLFIEGCTKENLKYAPWGGKTLAEKEKTIFSYHMSPQDMVRVKNESGVKGIVMIHEQYFGPPAKFTREGLLNEMKRAGVKPNIYSSIDGDIY